MRTQYFKDIHIRISGEESKYIVFLHGNSLSSETFKLQLEDVAFNRFTLLELTFPDMVSRVGLIIKNLSLVYNRWK